MPTTTTPTPRTQRVVTSRVPPEYLENDRIIEMEALRLFKVRLEWLGNPRNKFSYTIAASGACHVFGPHGRSDFVAYADLSAAIDAAMKAKS